MALSLTIEKEFAQNSERIKSVDLHPTEPWVLVSLYSGAVCIWNYQSQTMEKSFKVTESPVRSAKFVAREHWIVTAADDTFIRVYNYDTTEKFVAREHWIVTAADDKFIRVYNYDTTEKIKEFEAHTDYIRSVTVHPTLPYLLSCSDDNVIKLWDWEKDWSCTQIFEGHSHYVIQVAFNPHDADTFSSASLDGTVKVWRIGSAAPEFTLEGHLKGVNCVDYFIRDNKTYLLSGSDDFTVKVWDYETKSCVQTLEGHEHNVTAVCVHPELPIIITASEDGNVHIWHATTFRLEKRLSYDLERVWAIAHSEGSDKVAFGFDKGIVVVKMNGSVDLQA